MHAEIVAIGSELLLGEIVDTNSSTIAKKLQGIGLPLYFTATVGDDRERMVAVIRLALTRSNVVITTGGLGPTADDLTRSAVAEAVGQPLLFDEHLLRQIEGWFHRSGRIISENNRLQAFRPANSIPLENPVGTAPCFIVETATGCLISLPGVPKEMEYLMDHAVLPYLRRRFSLTHCIKSRVLKTSGVGESLVDERVSEFERMTNPSVGLNASVGQVIVRITADAENEAAADDLIAPVEAEIRKRLGQWIFGADDDSLVSVIDRELLSRGQQVALLEQGTGARLTSKLDGWGCFAGARISPIASESAAFTDTAGQIAAELGATWGLSIKLENRQLLVVALNGPQGLQHTQRNYGGHPDLAPEWAANIALDMLLQTLRSTS